MIIRMTNAEWLIAYMATDNNYDSPLMDEIDDSCDSLAREDQDETRDIDLSRAAYEELNTLQLDGEEINPVLISQ